MPIADFPVGLTTLLEGGWVRSYPAIDIYFSDSTELHLSTVPITVDSITYDDKLVRLETLKSSRSKSIDRAEFVLDNSDLAIGDTFLSEDEEILDNVFAVVSQIYVNPRDETEKYRIEKMAGLIQTYSEDGATGLNATLISLPYSGRSLTRFAVKKSCVWQYKDGINCDYSGDLPTCDMSFFGANGCIAHFGNDDARARYGGGALELEEQYARTFAPLVPLPGTTTSTRSVYTLGCFLGNTPIYTNDRLDEKNIREFLTGDDILGHKESDLLPIDDLAKDEPFSQIFTNWYHLTFSDGSELNVTGTHPFYPEPDKRVLVMDFQEGMKFRRLTKTGWRTVKLVTKTPMTSKIPMKFFNVPVTKTHNYYANGFPVSNIKYEVIGQVPLTA